MKIFPSKSIIQISYLERFTHWGSQDILFIFLVEQLFFSDTHAIMLIGLLGFLAYTLSIPMGYIANRLLPRETLLCMGFQIITLGYGILALCHHTMQPALIGLLLLAFGNGMIKSNVYSNISEVFYPDKQKHSHTQFFFYFYILTIITFMGIGFASVCRTQLGFQWTYMTFFAFSMLQWRMARKQKLLIPQQNTFRETLVIYAILMVLLIPLWFTIQKYLLAITNSFSSFAVFIVITLVFLYTRYPQHRKIFIYITFSLIIQFIGEFLFRQNISIVIAFIRNHVDKQLLGYTIQPERFLLFEIIAEFFVLYPFYCLWKKTCGVNGVQRLFLQCIASTLILGISYLYLSHALVISPALRLISAPTMVVFFMMQAIGICALVPAILSLQFRLTPLSLRGVINGLSIFTTACASFYGGKIVHIFDVTQYGYSPLFQFNAILGIVSGIILYALLIFINTKYLSVHAELSSC